MSAATKATTANARGLIAANMIKNQTIFGRAFDDCFEMGDGAGVMEYLIKKAATDYKLAVNINCKMKRLGSGKYGDSLAEAVENCIKQNRGGVLK